MEAQVSCPVCLGIPEKEIYQCRNGHIVCSSCVQNLQTCPQCRISFGSPKIRARILEEILEQQCFPCSYQNQGCTKTLKRSVTSVHAKACSYNPDFRPLGGSICSFKDCKFNTVSSSRDEIIFHFKTQHFAAFEEGDSFIVYHDEFQSVPKHPNVSWWSPIILSFGSTPSSPLFLVQGKVDSKVGIAGWVCIKIWAPAQNDMNYEWYFSIQPKASSQVIDSKAVSVPSTFPLKVINYKNHGCCIKKENIFSFSITPILNDCVNPDGSVTCQITLAQVSANMRDMGKKLRYKEVWTFVQQLYEGQQELELSNYIPYPEVVYHFKVWDVIAQLITAKLQRLRVGQMTKLKQQQKPQEVFQRQLQEAELRKIMLVENKKLDEAVLLGRHADQLRIMEDGALEKSKLAAMKKNQTDEELLTMKKEIIEKHQLEMQKFEEFTSKQRKETEKMMEDVKSEVLLQTEKIRLQQVAELKFFRDKFRVLEEDIRRQKTASEFQLFKARKVELEVTKEQKQIDELMKKTKEEVGEKQILQKQLSENENAMKEELHKLEKQVSEKRTKMIYNKEQNLLKAQLAEKQKKIDEEIRLLESSIHGKN